MSQHKCFTDAAAVKGRELRAYYYIGGLGRKLSYQYILIKTDVEKLLVSYVEQDEDTVPSMTFSIFPPSEDFSTYATPHPTKALLRGKVEGVRVLVERIAIPSLDYAHTRCVGVQFVCNGSDFVVSTRGIVGEMMHCSQGQRLEEFIPTTESLKWLWGLGEEQDLMARYDVIDL